MGFQNFLSAFGNRASRRRARRGMGVNPSVPKDNPAPALPALFFETLEPRLLLSATPFTFTANPLISQNLSLGIVESWGCRRCN